MESRTTSILRLSLSVTSVLPPVQSTAEAGELVGRPRNRRSRDKGRKFIRRNRLVAVAGGGVSIDPSRALDHEHRIMEGREELAERRNQIPEAPMDSWWWD